MFVILVQRVLESGFVFKNCLGPHFFVWTAKYPSFHVFCFHNKNSILGNNNVVDLCRAILCGKGDIFNQVVFFGRGPSVQSCFNSGVFQVTQGFSPAECQLLMTF
jgi:hypothetical protein